MFCLLFQTFVIRFEAVKRVILFFRQVKTVNASSRGPILQLLWRAFNRHLPDISKYGVEQVIHA